MDRGRCHQVTLVQLNTDHVMTMEQTSFSLLEACYLRGCSFTAFLTLLLFNLCFCITILDRWQRLKCGSSYAGCYMGASLNPWRKFAFIEKFDHFESYFWNLSQEAQTDSKGKNNTQSLKPSITPSSILSWVKMTRRKKRELSLNLVWKSIMISSDHTLAAWWILFNFFLWIWKWNNWFLIL